MTNRRANPGYFDREGLTPLTGKAWIAIDCQADSPIVPLPDCVVIGVDRAGDLPDVEEAHFDVLLTARESPAAPWIACDDVDKALDELGTHVDANPIAASILVELLRWQDRLSWDVALKVESLAYSTLLNGAEFGRWLGRRDAADGPPAGAMIALDRIDDMISVTLDDPEHRNAISAPMRDALFEALVNAIEDPSLPEVSVTGAGKCFSVGGHLPEFGTAADAAEAHRIRSQRSLAALVHALGERARVVFHGATIGSGLEIFAAAGTRLAKADSWFQLPELSMGLIPGAGGTVTVPRVIGRQRAAWMMLTGKRIGANQAHQWGLVQEIVA